MKEIWKNFAEKVKAKWAETKKDLEKLWVSTCEGGKKLLVEIITFIEEFVLNSLKALWNIISGFLTYVVGGLAVAIYSSVEYFFKWLISKL